ncbi:MAG: hypothetical protein RL596_335 [Bacteroidota bacterium]|jgi:hypothetical protein
MKKMLTLVTVLGMLITSCSSSKESTGVWKNTEKLAGKSYSKIFIVIMTADLEARSIIESDISEAATAKGYANIKSMDVMPVKFSETKLPSKEEILAQVKANNCDAVFIATLLKKEEDVRYTPGTAAYTIAPFYSWHGNFFGYYNHWQPIVSTPGYYNKSKTYFVQSNLYDVASQEVMWSVQSKVFDPTSLKKFSGTYTSSLVKQLTKEGLLKK